MPIKSRRISPVLANVYLNFVLDLWFEKKVRRSGANGREHLQIVKRQRLRWQSHYDAHLYAQTNISAAGIRADRCRGSNQRTSSGDSFYPSKLSVAHRTERPEYDAVAVSQATWPAGCKPCGESRTEETPPEDVRRSSEEDQRGSEEAVGGSKGEGVTTHPRRRRP
jgi:hypothetical protein